MITQYITIAIGTYLIIFSFIMNTENIKTDFIFKIIPFFYGSFLILNSLISMGMFK